MCANGFGDGMVTEGHVELGWWVRIGLGGEWGPRFGGVDLAKLTWGLWPRVHIQVLLAFHLPHPQM